jgi:wobble nucleotide-excising tRNase
VQELYKKVQMEFQAIESFFKAIGIFIDQKNNLLTKFKTDNTDEKLQFRIVENTGKIGIVDKELIFINGNKITGYKIREKKEEEQKELQALFTTLETKYKTALKEYEEYCSANAFSNILLKIQDYFKAFNFSFELELKTDPTGNKTEFPFAFRVLDFEGNDRDFKEGLSEGEIQVLSLCFFFAFLDIQKDKNQKILVFDDPITSLDNSNLSCLVDLISEEQKNFSQIFVFTHHRTFFKFLRKRFDKSNEYNLIRNKKEFGGSFVCKSKSDKFLNKLKNFETDLAKIPPASLDIELKVVEYGQYLRYEVERHIKNNLLHWNTENFTIAIDGIKTNKLITDDDLNKIKGIYSFCNWTTSHVDVGDDHGLEQLKTKIADFVGIINA